MVVVQKWWRNGDGSTHERTFSTSIITISTSIVLVVSLSVAIIIIFITIIPIIVIVTTTIISVIIISVIIISVIATTISSSAYRHLRACFQGEGNSVRTGVYGILSPKKIGIKKMRI